MSRIGIDRRSLKSRKENRNSYEVGDLAEWLLCDEFGGLVLALVESEEDCVVGESELLEHDRDLPIIEL